jgi:hypothetical protein
MDNTRTTSSTEEPEHNNEDGWTVSVSLASRRRVARWRGQTGLRRAINIGGALLVVVLLVIAIAPTDDADTPAAGRGQEPANAQRSSENSTDQQYEPSDTSPGQGTASVGQQLNQPTAVPSYQWQGWDRYRDGRCAWLPTGLLDPIGPVGTPRPTSTSCIVSLGDGTNIRITWQPPQTSAQWTTEGSRNATDNASDSRRRAEVTTIAGLEARATRPFFLFIFFPGVCRVDLNTRSTSGLTVLAWNPHTRDNRCQTAEAAATLIAHGRIPAAGGTPWSDTPQQPTVASLVGYGACELLNTSITRLNGLDDLNAGRISISDSDHAAGGCELTQPGVHVRAWLTLTGDSATDASESPAGRKMDGQPRQLGSLPAYEKGGSTSCVVLAELLPGYTLGVSYETERGASAACSLADLVAATAAQILLDRS